jgi:hypothetical protein
MTLTFLILIGVFTLQGAYLSRLCWRAWRGERKRNLILIFVLYANFLWALVPVVVAMLTSEYDLFSFGYGVRVWSLGFSLEVLFFAIFILTMRSVPVHPRAERFANYLRATPESAQFVILALFVALLAYLVLMGPWSSVGYEGAGLYIKEDLASEGFTVGGPQYTIYRAILVPALCVLLFYLPKQRVPRFVYSFGVIGFIYVVLDSIASGSRGKVLEVLFSIAACMLVAGRAKRALLYMAATAAFLILFSGAITQFRGAAEEYAGESALSKSKSVFEAWGQDAPSAGTTLGLVTFLIRLDSVQDGGILAQQTAQSGEFATFRPFWGSLVAFFPRYFWEDKPLALSRDNTVAGLPWYIVMDYRDEPWNNGSVSTSGVAYWQLGYFGVIMTAIAGAFVVAWLSAIAVRGGEVGLFFFLGFCGMSHFRMPIGIDETLLILLQIGLPILLLHTLYVRWRPATGNTEPRPAAH